LITNNNADRSDYILLHLLSNQT